MARPVTANFTEKEKRAIRERDGGTCQLERLIGIPCAYKPRKEPAWEVHHIKPISEGGDAHDINNGALLHKKCHTLQYEALHGQKWIGARFAASSAARKYWMYGRYKGGHRPAKGQRSVGERQDP